MSRYLRNKTIYDVHDIVPIYNTKVNKWYDWTIRDKEWYPPNDDYIYFMTRPGHERWFTHEYLRSQIIQYDNSINR